MRSWLAVAACLGACQPGAPAFETTVALGEEVVCRDPSARDDQPYDSRAFGHVPTTVSWNWGGGSVVADFDGDGFEEIVAAVQPGLVLYTRGPSGLAPLPVETLGRFGLDYATGGSAADYDGDGDLDLYVLRTASHDALAGKTDGRNHLLRNRGDGTFDDVTDEAGVDGCTPHPISGEVRCWSSLTSAWGDVDGDGDLDLYVGNYGWVDETDGTTQEQLPPGDPDNLYRNNGDGTFTDASAELPASFREGWTYNGGLYDLDGDGDLDLYAVNDFGNLYPNRVLWNEGGTFEARAVDTTGLEQSMTGMGVAMGDLNGDRLPDFVVTQWARNALLESSPSGVWFDWAANRGLEGAASRGQRVGWGAQLGDVDNDADEDLLAAYGFLESRNSIWANPRQQLDALYLRVSAGDGQYRFDDEAREHGLAHPGAGRDASLVDFDHDGWLDSFVRNLDGPDVLSMARCGEGSWLEVSLRQPGTANTFAVGARIELDVGQVRQTRWILAGGTGFASSLPPEVHFGLAQVDTVPRLVVRWPDGERSVLTAVPARRRIVITREPAE
jgi:hypothetical protein